MAQAFEDALKAFRAGQTGQAQALLGQALRANPRDVQAWLLLEQCVEQPDRKKYCLQQVLLISPEDQVARQRLAALEAPPARAASTTIAPQPKPEPEPAPAAPTAVAPKSEPEPAPVAEPEPTSPPAPQPVTRPLAPRAAPASPEPDFDMLRAASSPPVTDLESALMDQESFQAGPFVIGDGSIAVTPNDDAQLAEIPDEPTFTTIAPEISPEVVSAQPLGEVTSPGIARSIDKNAIRTRLEQAVTNLEKGNKDEGVAQLEAIVADDPRNEMAWMWLGAAVDDDQRKRDFYQRALAINPRSKMARDYLKAVETKLGLTPDAAAPVVDPDARPGGPSLIWLALIAVIIIVIVGVVIFFILRRTYLG